MEMQERPEFKISLKLIIIKSDRKYQSNMNNLIKLIKPTILARSFTKRPQLLMTHKNKFTFSSDKKSPENENKK